MKREHREKGVWVGVWIESWGMIGGEEAVAQTQKDKGHGLRSESKGRIIRRLMADEGQRWVEATLIFSMTYLCAQA